MPGSRLNDLERRLLERWSHPEALPPNTLRSISIKGNPGLRGIKKLDVEFRYPLSVICGKNGSGKTTILAIAALGYHAIEGHLPRRAQLSTQTQRTKAYYTFRDFFYKGPTDPDITGLNIIWNYINHNSISLTKRSEKWMHYERRPARAVHYLGVSRALPAIEQNVLRSHFRPGSSPTSRITLNADSISRLSEIMGRTYISADQLTSKNYDLRTCLSTSSYSSFNMGAGEDILIDLLEVLQVIPDNSLLVIEEVELGLHPQALSRLAKHLQEVISNRDLQIIVSTHSRDFLDAVPRQARILIEGGSEEHSTRYSLTTRFAMGEISDSTEPEMLIYCEDTVAEHLIKGALALDCQQRKRVRVQPVGDKQTLAEQALSHVRGRLPTRHLVIWDGDVQDQEVTNWLGTNDPASKVCYCFLPGATSPERWIIELLDSTKGREELVIEFGLDSIASAEKLVQDLASLEDHHAILFEAEKQLNVDRYDVFVALVRCAKRVNGTEFNKLLDQIKQSLSGEILRGRT